MINYDHFLETWLSFGIRDFMKKFQLKPIKSYVIPK